MKTSPIKQMIKANLIKFHLQCYELAAIESTGQKAYKIQMQPIPERDREHSLVKGTIAVIKSYRYLISSLMARKGQI